MREARASGRPIIPVLTLTQQNCDFGASGCSSCSGYTTLTDLFNQTLFLGSEICFRNGGTSVNYDDIANYEGDCYFTIINGHKTCINHYWKPADVASWASGDEASALTNSSTEGGWTECSTSDFSYDSDNDSVSGYPSDDVYIWMEGTGSAEQTDICTL